MPDFIPVLIAAVLLMVVLLIAFSGVIVVEEPSISNSRTLLLGEDILITHSVGESIVSNFDTQVSNGVFSNEDKRFVFDVPNPADASEGILRFDVLDTNLYGNLLFFVNGNLVYNKPAEIGHHVFTFKDDIFDSENELEIKAESSGWKIWAPTVYKIKGNLSVNYLGERFETFKFNITRLEKLNLERATLRIFGTRSGTGQMIVKVNGVQVYKGFTNVDRTIQSDILEEGDNTLEISSEINSRYDLSSVQIILFFE